MLLTPPLTKNRHINLKQVSFFPPTQFYHVWSISHVWPIFWDRSYFKSCTWGGVGGGWQMGQREDFWPCELISVCAIQFLEASRASEYPGQHYRTDPGAHPICIHLAPKAPTNFPVPLPGLGLGSALLFYPVSSPPFNSFCPKIYSDAF